MDPQWCQRSLLSDNVRRLTLSSGLLRRRRMDWKSAYLDFLPDVGANGLRKFVLPTSVDVFMARAPGHNFDLQLVVKLNGSLVRQNETLSERNA